MWNAKVSEFELFPCVIRVFASRAYLVRPRRVLKAAKQALVQTTP